MTTSLRGDVTVLVLQREQVQWLVNATRRLLEMERTLERGESIDRLLPKNK